MHLLRQVNITDQTVWLALINETQIHSYVFEFFIFISVIF